MMRFLAVCSTTRFWTCCTFSEDSSNNSEKKSKKFFSVIPFFQSSKTLRNAVDMHFLTPSRGHIKLSGTTLFFIFFIKAERKYAHFFGFYSNSNGE